MNTDFPKVSIGLITYNHAAFVAECLDSIRLQDYPHIELFVSDDGSTDDTAAVIGAYMQKYPQTVKHFVAQERNLGIAENCNFLIEQFTGKYAQIFSGDDIMLPGKIASQVAVLETNPQAVMCFSNMEWFWSETNRKICHHFGMLQKPKTDIDGVIKDFSIPTPTLMVKTDIMRDIGYDSRLRYLNDCFFVMRVMAAGPVVYLPRVTVRYRKHKGSLTLQNYFYEDRQKLLVLLKETLPERYGQAIQKYTYTINYAKIMTLLQEKRKMAALKEMPTIMPVMFMSPKWFARFGALMIKMVK